jgi:hypothetical protein
MHYPYGTTKSGKPRKRYTAACKDGLDRLPKEYFCQSFKLRRTRQRIRKYKQSELETTEHRGQLTKKRQELQKITETAQQKVDANQLEIAKLLAKMKK